jgi:O-antigen ligase
MDPADDSAPGPGLAPRSLTLLLLLPVALVAWPFFWPFTAPLEDDPYPHVAGAGLLALALVPAALGVALARAPIRWRTLLGVVGLWAWIAAQAFLTAPVDPFEARRAVVHAGLLVLGFAGGFALARGVRRDVLLGLALLSLALTGGALARFFFGNAGHLAGVLGNSGLLSQAALPGAVAGAWLALAPRDGSRAPRHAARALGLAAFLAFVVHAALAPVWAGALSLALALALAALLERGPATRRRALLLASALALALTPVLRIALRARSSAPPSATPERVAAENAAPLSPAGSADVGGVAVRLFTWSAIPAVVAAHPLLGLGPGQFRAHFPAFRSTRELVLSRHGDCSRADTEVEHAHQDIFQAFAELGLPGGILVALLAGAALLAALRALCSGDAALACAGAALLALLANALLHAPFFANPTAALLGALLAGIVARGPDARASREGAAAFGVLGIALPIALPIALTGAWLAWPLVRHGRALVDYVHAAERIVALQAEPADRPLLGGDLQAAARDARAAVTEALAAAPDSAYARLLDAHSAPEEQGLARWRAVLALRPESTEALEGLGLHHARRGDVEPARAAWERALALSAGQVRIQENLARLELVDGSPERGLELVEGLRARGCLDERWARTLGIELVLRGKAASGARLFLGRELEALVPEELFAAGERVPDDARELELPHRAEALKALAQLLWARAHVDERDFDAAIRSYRQAFLASRLVLPAGAPSIGAELAAAEALAGRPEEARRTLAPLADELDPAELPSWVRRALEDAALLETAAAPASDG